jgi:hypothetical protein
VVSAGTDANVYISLFGEKSKIVRHALKNSETGSDPFEKAQKDDFIFDGDDIGKVRFV